MKVARRMIIDGLYYKVVGGKKWIPKPPQKPLDEAEIQAAVDSIVAATRARTKEKEK